MNRFIRVAAFWLLGQSAAHAVCNLSGGPLAFGAYDVFDPLPNDSIATLTVRCTGALRSPVVSVTIGPSLNSGGFLPRRMRHASGDLLSYNFFTDAARTRIWGDGTVGAPLRLANAAIGRVSVIVYGRIPPGQDVRSGAYSDSAVVTVNW